MSNLPVHVTSAVGNPATAIRSRSDLEYWANHAMLSGFIKGAEDLSRGVMKLAYGMEYGLTPIQSLVSVHIIENKPSLPGNVLAGLIDNSDRYKYRVEEKSPERCVLRFYKRDVDTREWEDLGTETFTIEEATQAALTGKDNWKKYPAKMLFWRALTNGFDSFCAGLQLAKAYTHDEMGADYATDEEVAYEIVTPADVALDEGGQTKLRLMLAEAYGDEADAKEVALATHFSYGMTDQVAGLTLGAAKKMEDGLRAKINEAVPLPAELASSREERPLVPMGADPAQEAEVIPPLAEPAPDPQPEAPRDPLLIYDADKGDEWTTRHKQLHAEGTKQYPDWNETSKDARDGRRHAMVRDLTGGATDSSADLSLKGIRALLDAVQAPPETPLPTDPAELLDAVMASDLQLTTLRWMAGKSGVSLDGEDEATDDAAFWMDRLGAFSDKGRDRLAKILANPAETLEMNATAVLDLAQTKGDVTDTGYCAAVRDVVEAAAAEGAYRDPAAVRADVDAVLQA